MPAAALIDRLVVAGVGTHTMWLAAATAAEIAAAVDDLKLTLLARLLPKAAAIASVENMPLTLLLKLLAAVL